MIDEYIVEGNFRCVSSERSILTMAYFIQHNLVTPGKLFVFADGSSILIGDASPYHKESENDGGIGWNLDEERKRIVVRVIDFSNLIGPDKVDFAMARPEHILANKDGEVELGEVLYVQLIDYLDLGYND